MRLPLIAIPPGTPTKPTEVIGRRLTANVGIGEVISVARTARPHLSELAAKVALGHVAVPVVVRDVEPVVVVGDRVTVVDASGIAVTNRALVLQAKSDQITLSIPEEELSAMALALAGPVTVAVLSGADQHGAENPTDSGSPLP